MALLKRLVKVLGLIGLGWLVYRVLGPELEPGYRVPQERPLRVAGRTVFVGRKELFVRETGPADAPALVLVHGWSFDSEMTFFRLLPLIADRYRLVIPDLRNHGKSDRIRGRFEIEDLADELAGVLDAIGTPDGFALFGYSMGGMVAQAYADRYPGRAERLILGATAARPIRSVRILARIAFWLARGVARISKKESAVLTYRILRRDGLLDDRYEKWMWDALLNRDATLFYESGHAVWRFDSRAWVTELNTPALVIIPTEDVVVPTAAQRELAVLLPDATVVELEHSGHEAILSRAADIAGAIEAFIPRSAAGGADTGRVEGGR